MLREGCGCVVAVTVRDDDTLHYIDTVAGWKRKLGRCRIELMTVEAARAELDRTFEAQTLRGPQHWRKLGDFHCRPDLRPAAPVCSAMISGPDDTVAEAALAARAHV